MNWSSCTPPIVSIGNLCFRTIFVSAVALTKKKFLLPELYSLKSVQIWSMGPLTSEDHKMDTNEDPNIFGCHIIYRMNIQIYSDATNLPNKYPNIFVFQK